MPVMPVFPGAALKPELVVFQKLFEKVPPLLLLPYIPWVVPLPNVICPVE
jgi:hypothetical protein